MLLCIFLLLRFPFVSVSIGFTVKKVVSDNSCKSHVFPAVISWWLVKLTPLSSCEFLNKSVNFCSYTAAVLLLLCINQCSFLCCFLASDRVWDRLQLHRGQNVHRTERKRSFLQRSPNQSVGTKRWVLKLVHTDAGVAVTNRSTRWSQTSTICSRSEYGREMTLFIVFIQDISQSLVLTELGFKSNAEHFETMLANVRTILTIPVHG